MKTGNLLVLNRFVNASGGFPGALEPTGRRKNVDFGGEDETSP